MAQVIAILETDDALAEQVVARLASISSFRLATVFEASEEQAEHVRLIRRWRKD